MHKASCAYGLAGLACASILALTAPARAQIDGSGTITTGGVAQQVFAGRAGRAYLFCQNPIAATEPLLINAPGAAGATNGSYELAAGASLTFHGSFVPQGPVSAFAVTTGHRFVCKEG